MINKKVFWIIDPYCAIPTDEWGYRHALSICDAFSNGEYEITYITANFSHATKKQRGNDWEVIRYNQYSKILLVPTRAYHNHLGLKRLIWLRDFSNGLLVLLKNTKKLDLIYYPAPLIFGDSIVERYKKKFGFRLIIDIRDLWPEILIERYQSKLIKIFLKILAAPVYQARATAVRTADAITAPSSNYLRQLGVSGKQECVIYYSPVSAKILHQGMSRNLNLPINKFEGDFWVVMTGTLGSGLDTDALIGAARILRTQDPTIKFIFTGDGDSRDLIVNSKQKYSLDNIYYLGVLSLEKLYRLYHYADVGLSAYKAGSTVAMPTKAYEYVTAGLPIINSLEGDFADFVEKYNIGLSYKSGSGAKLSDCILSIKNDENLHFELRANLKDMREFFDRDMQYKSYVGLADKILSDT